MNSGGALAAGELVDGGRELGVELEGEAAALEAAGRRAGAGRAAGRAGRARRELARASNRARARARRRCSHSRCQTAKSAYCSSAARPAATAVAAAERGVERGQLRRSTRSDQASNTMWWMARDSTCSSSRQPEERGPEQRCGRRARAVARPRRRARAPARPPAALVRPGEVGDAGRSSGAGGWAIWTGRPATDGNVVRRISWRRTSSVEGRPSASTSSGPRRRTASKMV